MCIMSLFIDDNLLIFYLLGLKGLIYKNVLDLNSIKMVYKLDFILLFVFWSFFFFSHSFLASRISKEFVQKKWRFLFLYYRIGYNIIAVFSLFLIVYYQGKLPAVSLFKTTVFNKTLGYIGVFLGFLFTILSFKNYSILEFLGFDFKQEIKQVYTLNTTGLNKYVRHPLYFATLLLVWGYFLLEPTVSILIMNLVVTLYLIIGTKIEERKLVDEFGEKYKDYMNNVPMLLPWFPK